MLESGKFYGYRADRIYESCCKEFGFDPACARWFGTRKRLFSAKATPEGWGVWFISNSNWTKTKGGSWSNVIAGNYSWVEEAWDVNPGERMECLDFGKRVVFAKDPKHADGYIFLGIFEPVSFNDRTRVRRYERVACVYGIKADKAA